MAKNVPGGPPARDANVGTAGEGGVGPTDAGQQPAPTQVDSPNRTLPALEGADPKDVRPAERIGTTQGSSAQANSGAAFAEQLFGPEDEDEDEEESDAGPKLVVLHHIVNGPGGGPFNRGKVIGVSQLLGADLMTDENRRSGRSHLKRYIELGAIRPATRDESRVDFVQLPEGEEALSTALDDANARADAERARADELQRQLRAAERQPGSKVGGVDVDSLLEGTKEGDEF